MTTPTKTALITGGASGIGLAMARHFAAQGYNIAVLDVNVEAGEQAVAEEITPAFPSHDDKNDAQTSTARAAKAVFKVCDVSSWQSQADVFKAVHAEFGRIDVVCANAGIGEGSRGQNAMASIAGDGEEPQEPELRILDVNLAGVIYCKSMIFFSPGFSLVHACGPVIVKGF